MDEEKKAASAGKMIPSAKDGGVAVLHRFTVNTVSISTLEKAVLSIINAHSWTVPRSRWKTVCG